MPLNSRQLSGQTHGCAPRVAQPVAVHQSKADEKPQDLTRLFESCCLVTSLTAGMLCALTAAAVWLIFATYSGTSWQL